MLPPTYNSHSPKCCSAHTAFGVHSSAWSMDTGDYFPYGQICWDVKLSAHFHLVSRLKMSGAPPPVPIRFHEVNSDIVAVQLTKRNAGSGRQVPIIFKQCAKCPISLYSIKLNYIFCCMTNVSENKTDSMMCVCFIQQTRRVLTNYVLQSRACRIVVQHPYNIHIFSSTWYKP